MTTPAQFTFDNSYIDQLPADSKTTHHSRQVEGACFSYIKPSKVSNPSLLSYSPEAANLLGFSTEFCHSTDFLNTFSGNQLLDGMKPFACCYGGHQFGNWAGQLGDGRAINLGEMLTPNHGRQTLQLKGSGSTPYSRRADGLAVLRSSLREYLCSEAMHHLGVPTTRALSLMLTGDNVTRDMFYDGNPQAEPGAVVCRVAPSFLRFGSFELPTVRGDIALTKKILDYSITTFFSHLGPPSKQVYIQWFNEVCQRTADMVCHWQRVGFVHGVMNTDNMSILGLTIDYGPYGWVEDFDLDWTPNTTDAQGRRYRFGNQPQIAQWNLFQLANAIFPIVEDAAPLRESLQNFNHYYNQSWQQMMANKLGLTTPVPSDNKLFSDLESLLQQVETDMTIFYRQLAQVELNTHDSALRRQPLLNAYYQAEQLTPYYFSILDTWLDQYQQRVTKANINHKQRQEEMDQTNPLYVLRNYLAQQAIDQVEEGNASMLEALLETLRNPYTKQANCSQFEKKRPEWARTRAGCSMLSCSS